MKVFDSITVISTPSPLPSLHHRNPTTNPQSNQNYRRTTTSNRKTTRSEKQIKAGRSTSSIKSYTLRRTTVEEQEEELVVGPLTDEEFNRVYEMKNASRYYTWRDIGRELNRDWRRSKNDLEKNKKMG